MRSAGLAIHPSPTRGGAALVLLVALALAAPTQVGAEWSAPQVVSGAQTANIHLLAYGRGGDGLLVWSGHPGAFYGTAVKPAGQSEWRAGPRLASRLGYLHGGPAVALYGRSRALLVAPRRGGSGSSLRYRMVAAFGRSDGTFGPLERLDAGAIIGRRAPRSLSPPTLAVNAAGDALAAWARTDGRTSVVRISERRAHRPLRATRTISPQDATSPAVAINARRQRIVAWYRAGRIEARVRRANAPWGPVLRVARAARRPATVKAAVDRNGRFLLAWATLDYREGSPSALAFDAAVQTTARGWKHRPLDRYSAHGAPFSQAEQHIEPIFDSADRGFVAWHGRNPTTGAPAAKIAQLDNGNAVARTMIVADAVRPTDLAVGGQQRLAIVWDVETSDFSLRSRIGAAIRTAGSGFRPAETLPVSCPTPALCVPLDPRAAFDPATGRVTVAWLQRDDADWRIWVSTRTPT